MVRDRRGHNLETRRAEATDRGIGALARVARGLAGALAAVTAGLSLNWSNGVTEGLMHRLTWLTPEDQSHRPVSRADATHAAGRRIEHDSPKVTMTHNVVTRFVHMRYDRKI